jgi:hypothetical protein
MPRSEPEIASRHRLRGLLPAVERSSISRFNTVWTRVTDTRPQSKLARWSIAAAVFGGACNLLLWIVTYQDDGSIQPNSWHNLILTAIILAPSLVLFAFRYFFPVVFIYASALFWILVWRIEYPHQYYVGQKMDGPGVVLLFLGVISAAVFVVWAAIRFVIFIWRVLKSNRGKLRL